MSVDSAQVDSEYLIRCITKTMRIPIMQIISNLLAAFFVALLLNTAAIGQPDKLLIDVGEAPVVSSKQSSPSKAVPSNREKPLEPAIKKKLRELVNTSHDGLIEQKTDKGVEINLQGRFRTAPVATIDDEGKITIRDYTSPPGN